MNEPAKIFCPWCGAPTPMDYIHGHAQCVNCKTNIAPCCDGENGYLSCETTRPTTAPPEK
ncbi:MAG: hypothetical protein CMM35_01330 [Rhodospirillaceae bacterium]|nr:hypothetical protein [Rhodospirillaceae bacterium]